MACLPKNCDVHFCIMITRQGKDDILHSTCYLEASSFAPTTLSTPVIQTLFEELL